MELFSHKYVKQFFGIMAFKVLSSDSSYWVRSFSQQSSQLTCWNVATSFFPGHNIIDCVWRMRQQLCSLRTKPWLSNDAANSGASAGSTVVPLYWRWTRGSGQTWLCLSFSSESAERLLQSPGEFRGVAGAGQSDAVLLRDGRLHAGRRAAPTLMSCRCTVPSARCL